MSYYDEPIDTGEMDPAAMDQAYIDYMIANGVGAGLLPQFQPSGKQMTTSNITGALSANRSALFDTAFQGLGGPQAFAPGAFEPTVSTSIKQTPELQQMYGYLRAPDSYEGLIANEILNGGNSSTALRKIRELLADENTDPALKNSLLLELPQRPVEYGMPAPELTVENVNWDADENSVAERARGINELYAQIPRVGPSGPQWGVDPQTGQPIQISAGGELQWGEDESGNPVLVETTVTPSEAAQTFTDLGLPTPADEYTTEDFLPAGFQDVEANYLGGARPAEQAALQDWLTAQQELKPSNRETMTPYDPDYAPGGGGGGGGGGGDRPLTPEQQAALALYKLTNRGNPIAAAAGQAVEAAGAIPAVAALGPLSEIFRQIAGGNAPNPLVAGPLSAVAGGGWRGADEIAEAAMSGLGSLFGLADPQTAAAQPQPNPDQTAQIAALIQQAAQGNQSVDLDVAGLLGNGGSGGLAQQGVGTLGGYSPTGPVAQAMSTFALGNAPGVPPRPRPPGEGGGALDPYLDNYATPIPDDMAAAVASGQALGPPSPTQTQAPPPGIGAASGSPFSINLAPAPYQTGGPIPPATINGQPNPAYQDYLDTILRGQFGQDRVGTPPQSETAPWTTPQAPPPGIGAASGNPFAINTARSPLAGPPQGGLPQSEQAITRRQAPTSAPQSEQALTATPQLTNAMIAAILGGGGPSGPGGLPQSEQAGRGTQVRGQTPTTAPQSEQTIQRQAMQRYQFPEIATGERSARDQQRTEDEQNAQIFGGSTDRTGRRVRPTRSGEQARAYRAAHDQYIEAFEGAERERQRTYGYEYGAAVAQAGNMRRAGVRPLDQALMARRLVLMNAGMPQGV